MASFARTLQEEIARLARSAYKADMRALKTACSQHKKQIVQLQRQVAALQKLVARGDGKAARGAFARTQNLASADSADGEIAKAFRFNAKGLAEKRQRLGLSAAEMGKLLGVSALSVYKWESGQTRPRRSHFPAISAVRAMGKREAQKRLQELS